MRYVLRACFADEDVEEEEQPIVVVVRPLLSSPLPAVTQRILSREKVSISKGREALEAVAVGGTVCVHYLAYS